MTKRRSSWRRWVARGAVCVGLGLVTTVGVAWGAVALNLNWGAREWSGLIGPHDDWTLERTWDGTTVAAPGLVRRSAGRHIFGGWGIDPRVAWAGVQNVAYQSKLPHARESWGSLISVPPPPGRQPESRLEQAAGWPWLAVWTPLPKSSLLSPFGSFFPPASAELFADRVFPMRPIWCGLIIDCAIYGVAWWCALFVPGDVRRRVRRRRGWCPACGYDLVHKFDAGCPECGWGRDSDK